MAVVSSDHGDESMNVSDLATKEGPRLISPKEIEQHNGKNGSFWAVIDGFVVDATDFVDSNSHPGGLRKLLATDAAESGATGKPRGFSFTRGRNAHFPQTGRAFRDGVKRFAAGGSAVVDFAPHGRVVILGRCKGC